MIKWQVRDNAGNVIRVFHGVTAEHQARQYVHTHRGQRLHWRNVSC